MSLHCIAPAKINLTLHVTGKRADGYHLLESLIGFASIHDTVTVEAADKLSLAITGPFAAALTHDPQENILLKTARLLAEKAGIIPNVRIALEKNLPIGSGIGGGSADAAALMHVLHSVWKLPFTAQEMQAFALQIGADVPVCYNRKTVFMSGIGEQLQETSIPPALPALLVNPLQSLSTIQVFKQGVACFSLPDPEASPPMQHDSFIAWLKARKNDLEPPAIALMPVITDILTALEHQPGCQLARMSGSGATCFGLFSNEEAAARAAEAIRHEHPCWWVQTTTIGRSVE